MARLIAGAAAGKPFVDPEQGGGRGASRPVRRRRMGVGGAAVSRRHRRRGFLRDLAQSGQRAAHPRHQGPHRGAGFLVRRRQPRRRRRQDRHHPSDGTRETISVNEDAPSLFLRGGCRRRGDPRRPAGIRLARHGLGRQPRQRCACSTNGAPRSGSNTRSRSRRSASTRISGRPLAGRRHGIAKREHSRPREAGFGAWRSASRISAPSRRARSCSTPSSRPAAICSTPAYVYGAGYTEALFGDWLDESRRARAVGASSARARTRRSAIPT